MVGTGLYVPTFWRIGIEPNTGWSASERREGERSREGGCMPGESERPVSEIK
jgi:hypothetical protein